MNIKKIVLTVKSGKEGKCNLNVKLEKNDKATDDENKIASVVYNKVLEAMDELK